MKLSTNKLNPNTCYTNATELDEILIDPASVKLFDQNGYHLTTAEQSFLIYNGYSAVERRHEDCLRYDWITWDKHDHAHINHSDLFERKGFADEALDQLKYYAKQNPLLYKLIKMKPKWGIDISIDYVSEDAVFEVFHYEWDSFQYELVEEKRTNIEQFVLSQDWDDVAAVLWQKRHEWYGLSFFDQTLWRTNYFGLPPEQFKNVIWDNK